MRIVSSLTQYLLYLTQIFVPEQSCTYVNNMTPDRFAVYRAVSKYSSNVLTITSRCRPLFLVVRVLSLASLFTGCPVTHLARTPPLQMITSY